jgi:hypothetical protein
VRQLRATRGKALPCFPMQIDYIHFDVLYVFINIALQAHFELFS